MLLDASLGLELDDVLTRSQASIFQIETVLFTSEVTRTIAGAPAEGLDLGDGDKLSPREVYNTKYCFKPPLLVWSDQTIQRWPTEAAEHALYAYNGEKFQTFFPDTGPRELSVRSEIGKRPFMAGSIPAVALPFAFVSPYEMTRVPIKALTVLSDNTVWETARQRARLVGSENRNGVDCAVVELRVERASSPDSPAIFLVSFSIEQNYYPIYWEESRILSSAKDYVRTRSVEVQELHPVQLETGQTVHFPLKLREVVYASGHENWIYETRITPDSLSINQPVLDSLFTLSPLQAKVYIDEDDGKNSFAIPNDEAFVKTLLPKQLPTNSSSSTAGNAPENTPTSGLTGSTNSSLVYSLLSHPYFIMVIGVILLIGGLAVFHRSVKRQRSTSTVSIDECPSEVIRGHGE